ncbi:MAG: hypothetical protein MJE77_31240 [Proteobacteria bacterium]|nr:hypothetical protein [Pseudomonadota bacterium]
MASGIQGKKKVKAGEWEMNLAAVEAAGGKCGERGTLKFTPNAKARDTNNLRLLQIVKLVDASTGGDYNWSGGEARRNNAMTTEDKSKGVEGGFFVDHSAAAASPRSKKGDAAVSPYYRDYWPNTSSSQDGHKKGANIQGASLWDFPGWSQDSTFRFETAAKGADNGYIYGTVKWQFEISGSKIKNESWSAHDGQSATFDAAVDQFDEVYKNPGASTAP